MPEITVSRRTFLGSIVTAGIAANLPLQFQVQARAVPPASGTGSTQPPVREIDLVVGRTHLAIPGAKQKAITINGSVPAPLIRLTEGDDAVIRVTNRLSEHTSIHWHGLLVPANMDGVPGFSFPGIAPGETFTYRFKARQSGTYWYHSHSGGQEQQGMYGPLIIDPQPGSTAGRGYDRDHVVMLSDWSNENPHQILRNLKGDPGYYNYGKRTIPQLLRDLFRSPGATLRDREMWGRMRMDPTDIADVSGATYTYLMNGQSPGQNWSARFSPGERVRLRFINAAAMTYFDVKIPGLRMTVVQADGQDIEPVQVDELQLAVAETYDVIVEPEAGQVYTIFAQSLDRSGYARGTLGSNTGDVAPIPTMDPRPLRTMASMGMAHDHAATGSPTTANAGAAAVDHAAMGHVMAEQGTARKLAYADLVALSPNADVRDPDVQVNLRLTGDMERYFWTINNRKLEDAEPLRLKVGQRARVILTNETMMEHPMHLHGVFLELQNGSSRALAPRKHTVSVPPSSTVEAHLTFAEPGHWAFHCHLMYHMMTGMFVRVIVDPATGAN